MKLQKSNFAGGLRVRNTKQKIKNGPKRRPTFEFSDSLLSLIRMELQTSNFAGRLRVMDAKQKNENWANRGRGLGHMTYFLILGPPIISG